MKKIIYVMLLTLMFALPGAHAKLVLDSVNFDPAIIAAGDEVDIVVQFHVEGAGLDDDKIGNPEYKFKVLLEGDDTLTKEYVTIQDSEGDELHGSLFYGDYYNKRFRVKVNNNALAGNYEFKLRGIWEKNGVEEPATEFLRFKMPVKREGIVLDINTLETLPAEVRPGDNYVKITSYVENVGQKDAKSVEINLELPEGLEASYSNNNRIWVGQVNAGESKEVTFFIDVNELAPEKVYTIDYKFSFMDIDDNSYEKKKTIPFLVKPRPYLEVVDVVGEGLSGDTEKMYVKIKNSGSESAESVDVRIIKQNAQPFEIDVRSDYIGELEPGEEGIAVFDIKINSDAEIKKHDFKLVIRSKGDSDEGDDTIYTYNRRASFRVTGKAQNNLLVYGLIGAGVIVLFIILSKLFGKKGGKKK